MRKEKRDVRDEQADAQGRRRTIGVAVRKEDEQDAERGDDQECVEAPDIGVTKEPGNEQPVQNAGRPRAFPRSATQVGNEAQVGKR